MTFESHDPAAGKLVEIYPERSEAETTLRYFNVLGNVGDAIKSCGLILTRTLLSVALLLVSTLFLTVAILRVARSAFKK